MQDFSDDNNSHPIQRDDKYSLKFVLISNFISLMSGIVIHYLTEHNKL